MRAVITVVANDAMGILAKVATVCFEFRANVIDVDQTVMEGIFTMIMLVDISRPDCDFGRLCGGLEELGAREGLVIHTMHEDIFNSMHKI